MSALHSFVGSGIVLQLLCFGPKAIMTSERISGVLLHVTSLPSFGGVGDFGPAAYGFVDFLAAGKQRLWQVLPLSPTGYGSSPYSALSAFAGNPMLISLEFLARDGWITWDQINSVPGGLPGHEGPCDFAAAFDKKVPLIEAAAANFLDNASPDDRQRFQRFCQENISWLTDYAMYTVLRRRFAYLSWHQWPEEFASRKPETLTTLMNESGRDLALEQVVQFFFSEQWSALRAHWMSRSLFPTTAPMSGPILRSSSWTTSATPFVCRACLLIIFRLQGSAGAIRSTSGRCWKSMGSTGGSPAFAAR